MNTTTITTDLSSSLRNGHDPTAALPRPRTSQGGRLSSLAAHVETGMLMALPLTPVVATFVTVLMYVDPLDSSTWRAIAASMSPMLMFPINIVGAWIVVAIPLAMMRLGTAARANSSSHAQLTSRLLAIEPYRNASGAGEDASTPGVGLGPQLDFVWQMLNSSGTHWILGDGFITVWRLLDRIDASLNYVLPRDRVWARAQGLLIWLPNQSAPRSGVPDPRAQLTSAIQVLGEEATPSPWAEVRERGSVAQIQRLIDSSKTDRYAGFVRARNLLLAACTLTATALYSIFWLGIIALPAAISQPILSAALFFTTIGALVGLFQLLYAESKSETGVDDYGLSVARLIVSPQLAALAALVGVVLTSLATSTLSGTPTAPSPGPTTIPDALNQIRNPANVLVAVAFALSPGLVFSRFRQTTEQSKRDLSKSSSASIVHTKAGS